MQSSNEHEKCFISKGLVVDTKIYDVLWRIDNLGHLA